MSDIRLNALRDKRKTRTRYQVKKKGGGRVRLSVFRSGKHIYAQLIDDAKGVTIASSSTVSKEVKTGIKTGADIEAAKKVGAAIAKLGVSKNVKEVVFDKGGYKYHGRVKALADAAREAGLSF